jgi:exonuclease SbcC
MAIKAIAFENFLSHEETEIAPDKGLTVITGTSDGGKSNIVRAITWAITGKPFGINWSSWFADKKATIRVGVEFDNGTWISREKSKNTNQYQVSSIDTPLKALRANVPDEVHEITSMTSVNMQGQDDGYFMLSSSPGEVGRMFNEAVGLQIIDVMISESKKAVVVYDARHRAAQEHLNSLQEQIAHYNYLDKIEPIITALSTGWYDYRIQGVRIENLRGLILESAALGMKIRGDKELIQIVRPCAPDLMISKS